MFKKTIVVLLMFSIALSSCGKKDKEVIVRNFYIPAETPVASSIVVKSSDSSESSTSVETFVPTPTQRLQLTTAYLAVFNFSLKIFEIYWCAQWMWGAGEVDFDIDDYTPPSFLQSFVAGHLADYTFKAYNFFNSNSSKNAVPAKKS